MNHSEIMILLTISVVYLILWIYTAIALLWLFAAGLLTPKQSRHTGLYVYDPPINSISWQSMVLRVKAASFPQSMHTADNLVTYSAIGTKDSIFPKGFL